MAAAAIQPGDLVRLRSRNWLVEDSEKSKEGTLLRLACVEDDSQGEPLQVVAEVELGIQKLDEEAIQKIGRKGFDDPRKFSAYINTLKWQCVTATNPRLFQSPFRAGIRLDSYQLEPLSKALQLPCVNLFIADDVGLGKTIEAGLIASELLLRKRVNEVVVACPPAMLLQWKGELETRFGLTFEIFDRNYVERIRRTRGYGVNPWNTFPRFLISQRLLIDETYAGPLRAWLDNIRPGSLLILDEAHHAAPASGSRYAIDSKITKAIRDLAAKFEHRIFLSATPHNGHSNSFSALLALLDDKRFTPGVPIPQSQLQEVMVRRLKDDVRDVVGELPKRVVKQVDIDGLPSDQGELKLASLLDEYGEVRRLRFSGATKKGFAQGILIISTLQQRLLSSVRAFHRTLEKHMAGMEKVWAKDPPTAMPAVSVTELLTGGYSGDDEESLAETEQLEGDAAERLMTATRATPGDSTKAQPDKEKALLAEMLKVAAASRGRADARIQKLIEWIQANQCSGAKKIEEGEPSAGAAWSDLRLIIFTEYEDTLTYLKQQLENAIRGTHNWEERIKIFHGPTSEDERQRLKIAFNQHPSKNSLRILLATDAAREGLNLQAHCWNLFHFDLPWNPSRLEQRNGRIDRKLQPNPEAFCHYFFYKQRPEDRVLKAIVRKTETIRRELGSLADVVENKLSQGIRRSEIDEAEQIIDSHIEDPDKKSARAAELEEEAGKRKEKLKKDIEALDRRIQESKKAIDLDEEQFRDAVSCALDLLKVDELRPAPTPKGEPVRYSLTEELIQREGESWARTLDTLRAPNAEGLTPIQYRKKYPLRPVIFSPSSGIEEDAVQLHLSHRITQRLLGVFTSQGYIHDDLSRACVAQGEDGIPRVVLLGRLCVYGPRAARLHEEVLVVAARWIEPGKRKDGLVAFQKEGEQTAREILEKALHPAGRRPVSDKTAKVLHAHIQQDIKELLPLLKEKGEEAKKSAQEKLAERARKEIDSLKNILDEQRKRVLKQIEKYDKKQVQLELDLKDEAEKKQLEANHRGWQKWLENVDGDLAREPKRIEEFYRASSSRIEPVGLVYLWPAEA
jgi:SNF2 family DNA or RNA helicase